MKAAGPMSASGDSAAEAGLRSRLAEAERELAHARQSLDAFVGAVSHDLQAPLRHVRAFADLLARRAGAALDKDAAGYVEFVRSGAARAQDMVAALASYARVAARAGSPGPVDAAGCVARAIETLDEEIARSGARIEVGPLPTLHGDGEQLTVVFVYLFRNAVQFCRKDAPPRVTVRAELCGEAWRFEVSDNGIGIEPGFMGRAFLPFQKADPNSGGLGMGLAVCRSIVERHGGWIRVESQAGQGSTFSFTVPGPCGSVDVGGSVRR